jgi:hypothetical protein
MYEDINKDLVYTLLQYFGETQHFMSVERTAALANVPFKAPVVISRSEQVAQPILNFEPVCTAP